MGVTAIEEREVALARLNVTVPLPEPPPTNKP